MLSNNNKKENHRLYEIPPHKLSLHIKDEKIKTLAKKRFFVLTTKEEMINVSKTQIGHLTFLY